MRTFSGTYINHHPEVISANRIQSEQTSMIMPLDKNECDPGRTGINSPPYRTEFRNLFK